MALNCHASLHQDDFESLAGTQSSNSHIRLHQRCNAGPVKPRHAGHPSLHERYDRGLAANQKGQAAVTDAMFMLAIIMGLTVFTFFFITQFGQGIAEQVSRNYYSTFSSSALKTLLYMSVPRNAGQEINVNDPTQEVDYLMALVKEDYGDDANIGQDTRKLLAKSLQKVMLPISDSFDYLFYINTSDTFAVVMLKRTEFDIPADAPRKGQNIISVNPSTPSKIYFCGTPDNPLHIEDIQKLKFNLGNAFESSGVINLVVVNATPGLNADNLEPIARVTLTMWVATLLEDDVFNALKCSEVVL